jgi:hypothetical protein
MLLGTKRKAGGTIVCRSATTFASAAGVTRAHGIRHRRQCFVDRSLVDGETVAPDPNPESARPQNFYFSASEGLDGVS